MKHTDIPYELYLGDCLDIMPTLPDKSVDMILCDLPYGTTACKWDVVLPFETMWDHYDRVAKPNAAILLFSNQPFTTDLIASNKRLFRYEWIVEKDRATGHLNANRMPLKAHDVVCVFYKKQPTYNPIKIVGNPNHAKGNRIGRSDGTTVYGDFKTVPLRLDSHMKYPKSVLKTKKPFPPIHPTEKSVSLCEYFILTYTSSGATILDNCMGSGTTGVACANTDRRFIGIEKEEKYYWVAQERIAEAYKRNQPEGLLG